ncbi:hypothetical protein BVX98_07120 [bacterium F11]|nr:hypothetical protein BVX98_07120 [bacterium F11]
MELKNKVVWITGGARIGASVAEALAKKGVHLVINYRSSKQNAIRTAKKINDLGRQTLILKADLTCEEDVKRCVQEIKKKKRG